MMKKSNAKLLSSLAMMLILSVPLGFAEDNSTFNNSTIVDNSTLTETNLTEVEDDMQVLDIPEGVALRFMQLERRLVMQIERGERIIAELQSLGVEDVSEFNLILDHLDLIREEASSYTNLENIQSASEAAVLFVDLKKESLDLIKEFRELVRSLHGNKIQALMNAADSVNNTTTNEERIRNMIRAYNSRKVKTALQGMGAENETLVSEISNSSLSKNQIRARLENAFENLNNSKGAEAIVKIQQKIAQNNVLISSINQTARTNAAVRQNERLQERIEKVEEKTATIRSSVGTLKDKINQNIKTDRITGNPVKVNNNPRGNNR